MRIVRPSDQACFDSQDRNLKSSRRPTLRNYDDIQHSTKTARLPYVYYLKEAPKAVMKVRFSTNYRFGLPVSYREGSQTIAKSLFKELSKDCKGIPLRVEMQLQVFRSHIEESRESLAPMFLISPPVAEDSANLKRT